MEEYENAMWKGVVVKTRNDKYHWQKSNNNYEKNTYVYSNEELILKLFSEHAGAFQSPMEDQRNGYLDCAWRSAGTHCL